MIKHKANLKNIPFLSTIRAHYGVFSLLIKNSERVAGDVSVDPTGPTPKITTPISENSTYASLSENLTLRFFHFVELQGKYLTGLKTEGRLDSIGAMLNLYLSKSLAVSYRFKHINLPKRSNEYHLLGIALII